MKDELSSLSLTSDYFKKLLEVLYLCFLKKHNLSKLPKAYQLFGYGDYDESKPNLKQDFEAIGTEFINGKYLYDKSRELYKGKPVIKLNKYYQSIVLLYMGYLDFQEFIEDYKLSENETDKQIGLISDESINKTYYYLSYYFGEDNMLLKGQTIISENFKKIQHTYVYPQDDGTFKTHYSYGPIIRREDTLHINTKTLLDGKLVEGGSEIYYIGHNDPYNANYLVGTYSTFDIYTQPVAGKSIFEKCDSREEMESRSKNGIIPPYIAQELRNQRIIAKNMTPKHFHELSENAPYAAIYQKIPGHYHMTFLFDNGIKENLKLTISNRDYRIELINDEIFIEKDSILLTNKGSILHFNFVFSGLIILDRVDIYFKTYFLNAIDDTHEGVFSGVDNENRLVSGKVLLKFERY